MQPPYPPPPQPFRGYPGPFAPPPPFARPGASPLAILPWIKLGLFVFVGLPALALVAWVIIGFEREKRKDLIVFDNRLETDVDVAVDGNVVLHVPMPETEKLPMLALPPHARKITVTANGKLVSEVTLALPPKPKGESNGYRGLYVIGAPRDYVLARVPYAEKEKKGERPQLVPLARPSSSAPLVELPRTLTQLDIVDLDKRFHAEEQVQENTTRWVSRICTWDRAKGLKSLGCKGYPGTSEGP